MKTWGIIPAAGLGSRIQPLAFSKELLPVGSRCDGTVDRPRAVSEYLVDRMLRAGATNIAFVISPGKSDIVEYYGGRIASVDVCYVVQQEPAGLCDAVFRASSLVDERDQVLVGLPDTIWFPEDGMCHLPEDALSFLCFPVDSPEQFDAVVTEGDDIHEIQVKQPNASSNWIWGAFKMNGKILHELRALWLAREKQDVYIGTLVNCWLKQGGRAKAVRAGELYADVGTLHGYRAAIRLLETGVTK